MTKNTLNIRVTKEEAKRLEDGEAFVTYLLGDDFNDNQPSREIPVIIEAPLPKKVTVTPLVQLGDNALYQAIFKKKFTIEVYAATEDEGYNKYNSSCNQYNDAWYCTSPCSEAVATHYITHQLRKEIKIPQNQGDANKNNVYKYIIDQLEK